MRTLVLLRGIPASGKSTWIKENNLEDFTLCLDDFRRILSGPFIERDGIDQSKTKQAANMLYQALDSRMEDGEFLIVDATHLKNADIDGYKKLTQEYRYRTLIVDFEISKEEAIKRDNERPLISRVGENIINKMWDRRQGQDISKYNVVNKDEFWQAIKWKTENFNSKNVNIFGDMHGCVEPLQDFFNEYPYSKDDVYIFLGDYLDRGKQNKEMLETVMNLAKKDNCIFLEGNHEKWLSLYANNKEEQIKSKDFLANTVPEIKDVNKTDIRRFCRNLRQTLLFEKDGEKYFLTHGGLPYYLTDEKLQLVPTKQLIKGVGGYERDIDGDYEKEYQIELSEEIRKPPIQIHGHRNIGVDNDGTTHCVNLEGKVEFNGNLKVWRNGEILKYQNNYKIQENDFFHNPLINVKDLGWLPDGSKYYSCNFTRDAFYSQKWDDLTTTARGLFIAEKDGNKKVIARGYDKFFNIGEREEDTIENIKNKANGPIIAYKKENGFLGIVSSVNGKLHYFSKSTDRGDYANMVKEHVEKALGENLREFNNYLKENNKTAVFEIVDIDKDPHIIKYDHSKAVLLDMIDNSLKFNKLPYQDLQALGKEFNLETKTKYREWKNYDEFKRWYDSTKEVGTRYITDLEGLVIESKDYMCKMKFDYYLEMKSYRKDMERIKQGNEPKVKDDFTDFMKENKDKLDNIINVREKYLDELSKVRNYER